ncbi:MAG TPA: MFS transporter [Polyangiaceae bacterium]|nr:MFS transporter [Polyangiaceae bacterium]
MRKGPHPAAFFFLILPYGGSFGFVSVALPYIATARGIAPSEVGAVVALAYLPHAWKFLWAPLVDATLTRKGWYLAGLALVVAGTFAQAAMPITREGLGALSAVVVASQLGLTIVRMALEGLIALGVPDDEKGKAAGWSEAGAQVGLGVGGGAALALSERLPRGWQVGLVMSAVMVVSALALARVPTPPEGLARGAAREGAIGGRARAQLVAILRDVWSVASTRAGLLGLLVALLPVGAGAASNLWSAVSRDWGVSADTVALVTGALGGLAGAGGAMAGGWLADRLNRRVAYALCGAATALTALAMAAAPRAPAAYVAFTLAYSFLGGAAYACFAAFVLECIGLGAVATKYNVFASLSNLAISYTTRLDAGAHERFGSGGMLVVDAGLTLGGVALLLALVALTRPPRAVAAPPPGA